MINYHESLHKELKEAVKHVIASPSFARADEKAREDTLIKSMGAIIEKAVQYHLADFKDHQEELRKNIKRELVAGFLVSPDSLADDLVKIVHHQIEYRAKKQGWIKA
jgi:hypothetical protein